MKPGVVRRWMYRGGSPNWLARFLLRIDRAVIATGLLRKWVVTLEVVGRRSGRTISVPLVVANYGGERYLVSMLGEQVNWVANVRAAGGRAVVSSRGRENVLLEEVEPAERAPILKHYLQVAPGARPHVPVDRKAPLAQFEAIAERYPVFRIRTVT